MTSSSLIKRLLIALIGSCVLIGSNAMAGETRKPELMLANVYRQGTPVSDYFISEKLDGVRAFWNGEKPPLVGSEITYSIPWPDQNRQAPLRPVFLHIRKGY